MEDAMKVPKALLALAIAGAVFVAMPARAFQAPAEEKAAPAATKGTKWQGTVVRIDKDHSTITIHGGPPPSTDTRQVVYSASTVWTKIGKPLEQHDEVKEGSFVIFVGTVDSKGDLQATRIDLRAEKLNRQ
jgi:hypothetical protein